MSESVDFLRTLDGEALESEVEAFNLIYDTVEVQFNLKRFLFQFYINIFFPFTYFQSPNPKAQLFTPEGGVSSWVIYCN